MISSSSRSSNKNKKIADKGYLQPPKTTAKHWMNKSVITSTSRAPQRWPNRTSDDLKISSEFLLFTLGW